MRSSLHRATSLNPKPTLADTDNRYARGLSVPFASLALPWVSGHRGAGASIAPENTEESLAVAKSMGLKMVNLDLQSGLGGALLVNHDATIDRTTTGTGNISDETAMSWATRVVDAGVWFATPWGNLHTIILDQALADWGSQFVFELEAFSVTAANQLVALAQSRGLGASFFPGSRAMSALAPIVAAGIACEYIDDIGAISPATLLAAGVKYITVKSGETPDGALTCLPAVAKSFQDAGVKVVLHTPVRKTELAPYLAAGVVPVGYETDEPLYLMHDYTVPASLGYRLTKDPFATQTWYHGMVGGTVDGLGNQIRGRFLPPNRWGFPAAFSGFALQGYSCPLAALNPSGGSGSYTIAGTLTQDVTDTDPTRWAGGYFNSPKDKIYNGGVAALDPNGMGFIIRQNGGLEMFKAVNNVTTQCPGNLASGSGFGAIAAPLVLSAGLTSGVAVTSLPVNALPAAVPSGAKFVLPTGQVATLSASASIAATSVTVTSITPSAAVASGASLPSQITWSVAVTTSQVVLSVTNGATTRTITWVDGTMRGPYWYLGQSTTVSTGGAFSWSSITIT